MKDLRKVFAWLCAVSILFSNVSFTGIASSEFSEETAQEDRTETKDPRTIRVGDSLQVQTDTVLLLRTETDREIVLTADAPVNAAVERDDEITVYPARDGELAVPFTVKPGDYRITFTCAWDPGTFTVRIWDAAEYALSNAPQEDTEPEETDETPEELSSGEEKTEQEQADNESAGETPEETDKEQPDSEEDTEEQEDAEENGQELTEEPENPEDNKTELTEEPEAEGPITEEPGEPVIRTLTEEEILVVQLTGNDESPSGQAGEGGSMQEADVSGTRTRTGYAAFEIRPINDEPAADLYIVPVTLENGIRLVSGNEIPDSVSWQFRRITEDGSEILDTFDAIEENGVLKGFTFETAGFPDFILKYTVAFHTEERVYTCSVPGAQDIALRDLIAELGVASDEEADVFMEQIKSTEVSDPESLSLTETEDGRILRVLKDSADASLTIRTADGQEYTIVFVTEGITELSSEDNTVIISTVDDLYLPEEASAYAEISPAEEAISAVQDEETATRKETTEGAKTEPETESGTEGGDTSAYQVFSIGLENVDTEDYEGFDVRINLAEEVTGTDFRLYQVEDGSVTDITDTLQLEGETERDHQVVTGFSFTTESFADYVLSYSLVTYYTASSGDTYRITLNYGPEAGIPEDAELKVTEILEDEEEYNNYLKDSAEKLGISSDTVSFARFFDIEIQAEGQKIEPAAPVSVTISLEDLPEASAEEINVVHFDQDGPVVLGAEISDNNEILFETDSFSVYAVITVPDQPTGVDGLDGRAFTISFSGNYMTKNIVGSNPAQLESTTEAADAAVWQFEETEGEGKYYIFTFADGVKKYLNLGTISDDRFSKGNISDTPQAFTVDMENSSYVLSATVGEKTHYLRYRWMDNSVGFSGSEWNVNESKLTLDFIQPTTANAQDYILVTQYEGEYYVILNDGTLEKTQLSDPQTLKIDDPMVWHYTGSNLYHNAKETGFDEFNLACDYYYRYLDPDVNSALIQEDIDTTTGHPEGTASIYRIDSRPYMDQIKINYSDNKINSQTNPSNYIGIVRDGNGNLKIAGKQSEASAATIYFAQVRDGELVYTRDNAIHHTVNHIDISIVGRVAINAPLAYGTYYYNDDNGQVQTLIVSRENPVTIDVSQNVDIEGDDIKRATITTFTIDPDDPTKHNPIDDVFYITGYSGNHETGESTNQTRIEGVFKVADLPNIDKNDPEQWDAANNRPTQAILDARLENRIYYTVSTTKPISFELEYNGKKLYQSSEAAAAGGSDGIAKGSATVTLGQTFDYWDSRNECPGINRDNWKNGGIDYGWSESTGAGMDFALGTVDKDKTGVLAIEITKYIVDRAGNAITPLEDVDNVFHIYRSPVGKTPSYNSENGNAVHYTDEVIGLDVDRWTEDYSGYDGLYKLVHDKTLTVGDGGMGTIYDYDVAAGMIYIEEDKNERNLPRTLEDVNGKNWTYISTQLETEYVWRDNGIEYRKHVSKNYTNEDEAYRSIPEVLGDYQDVNGLSRDNGFLEFYVYNIYDAEPIDISVKKEWKHQNGSYAEAPAGASVTVTLGRFKLVEDTDHPVNGTLTINHTVTKATENPDGHYYATYKVKQGNRVLRSGSYDGQNSQTMTGLPEGSYTFEITESVSGYTSETTLNGQQTTSIPITITANRDTAVNVNTTLEKTTFTALVNLRVTNSINGAENYYDHTFTFTSGSKIIVTVNRPGSSYNGGGFRATYSGGLGSGDVPWPDDGGYSNVDQDLEFTLPTVQETTTIELNFWHEWGPESFTIRSVTPAKTTSSGGNGTQNSAASASSASGSRSLQRGESTAPVSR